MAARLFHLEINTSIENIEEREQNVIQQIRTSGIRKPRETSLIEDILDNRKNRRKLLAMLTGVIEEQTGRTAELEGIIKTQQAEGQARVNRLEEEFEIRHRDMIRLQDMHKQTIDVLNEKHAKLLKEERRKTAAKYEQKLQVIELKLNELMQKNELKERERQERDSKATANIEQQCEIRVQKYKDAVASMSEREREYKDLLRRKSAQCDSIQSQLNELQGRLFELEKLRAAEAYKESEQAGRIQALERTVTELTDRCQMLELQNRDIRNNSTMEMTTIQQRHQEELANIDNRIRGLLKSKDDSIASLQRRVLEAEETSIEMENLLKEMNIK